jgi:carbamoyl-phosphate synthase small subunit
VSRSPAEGRLVLENGSEFAGEYHGADAAAAGEVVFTTAMYGYPESLTDPSFAGQLLVSTYPLIGNYGVPQPGGAARENNLQSGKIQVQGFIVQSLSISYSHHRAARSLSDWLSSEGVPLLTGVDTRSITMQLREAGTMRGWLVPPGTSLEAAQASARNVEMRRQVFLDVAPKEVMHYPGGPNRILLVDVGAKEGIVTSLVRREATVVRVPWHADLARHAREVDGILIGNGPGDPKDLESLTVELRGLLSSFTGPIFGLCLGHQLLARALGLETFKLPYGHRGANQPVKDIVSGRCYVTSQNHGYAVDDARLPAGCDRWFMNLNDGTNEGLRLEGRPVRSVQFHPEGMPGPRDTGFLFDDFLLDVAAVRTAGGAS